MTRQLVYNYSICKAADPLESKERAYEKKTYCDNTCRRNAFECMRVA